MKRCLALLILFSALFPLLAEDFDAELFALQIMDQINQIRAEYDLAPLLPQSDLTDLATMHSRNMAEGDFFSHEDREGLEADARLQKYKPQLLNAGIGENLYLLERGDHKFEAAHIVKGWMASDAHRVNILESDFTHTGVGVFLSGDKLYTTQLFAIPLARIITPLPAEFSTKQIYDIEFEYLSLQSKDNFNCLLSTPDPSTQVKVDVFTYCEGLIPLVPDWRDETHFLLHLALDQGKGDYGLELGWGEEYFTDMYRFRAD